MLEMLRKRNEHGRAECRKEKQFQAILYANNISHIEPRDDCFLLWHGIWKLKYADLFDLGFH